MKRLLACLILMTLGFCHAEVPKLFCEKPFTSATLAEAVNRYVAIGEEATIKELQQISSQENSKNEIFAGKGFSVNERVGWMCRILYEPKEPSLLIAKSGILIPEKTKPLRAPKFGVLSMPENTMPVEKWPLYPVAFSGSTYVVLKQGYTDSGTPEELAHYLAYCKSNGTFRKTPVLVPTKKQAEKDIAMLRQSEPWQAIKWEDNNGFSFPMGEQWTWAFIQNQAKAIPTQSIAARKPQTGPTVASLR
jgi:hypothetical protein